MYVEIEGSLVKLEIEGSLVKRNIFRCGMLVHVLTLVLYTCSAMMLDYVVLYLDRLVRCCRVLLLLCFLPPSVHVSFLEHEGE